MINLKVKNSERLSTNPSRTKATNCNLICFDKLAGWKIQVMNVQIRPCMIKCRFGACANSCRCSRRGSCKYRIINRKVWMSTFLNCKIMLFIELLLRIFFRMWDERSDFSVLSGVLLLKEFELYWGTVSLKSVNILRFLKSNWGRDIGPAKHKEVEPKFWE